MLNSGALSAAQWLAVGFVFWFIPIVYTRPSFGSIKKAFGFMVLVFGALLMSVGVTHIFYFNRIITEDLFGGIYLPSSLLITVIGGGIYYVRSRAPESK